jgi:hypothetical protein
MECNIKANLMDELPACAFPADVERGYDRSFTRFVEVVKQRG